MWSFERFVVGQIATHLTNVFRRYNNEEEKRFYFN
jgi:hypothetical protein